MFGFLRGGTPRIAPAEAVAKVKAKEAVLLDIREPMELRATGRAQGAIHVPMAAFAMRCDPASPECLPELKNGKPIILYCATGARSGMAGSMLTRMGHAQVFNLGGLSDWMAGGGQILR
ncbi:rhodanese-like domain-containing protein [Phaeovulum vinaykumarii]|uniref:Rhodanese-related sulfurtransferase n=1 Tax=Phaeovulum vinaykumarii TaxID=407234 RepID=A0A1N7L5K5_9RHOB|nr:rhodanese-like domain-containing protein [Phaeovulum vinaykumarii]SIS69073.1 Rhodanese-related sulfurtransferase [Phaeovulum vinaykumarii]SOB99684.1 rhodanese-related sulfurtransferase [Phaeovulum vinaykumarii]